MDECLENRRGGRYREVAKEKIGGETYTPRVLADFVARQMVSAWGARSGDGPIRVLDPAVGDGELLVSLLGAVRGLDARYEIDVIGFDLNTDALRVAETRIGSLFPSVSRRFEPASFLELAERSPVADGSESGAGARPDCFDLIIANPPYVRTQILGADQARELSRRFGLSGRIDLYYAFVLAIGRLLKPSGVAGIILSNRFMTTRSGASLRRALVEHFNIRQVWDLGDTKVFEAAVLPAVLIAGGKDQAAAGPVCFTSIYQTDERTVCRADSPIAALAGESGVVEIDDGRCFRVQRGTLEAGGPSDGVWRVASDAADAWLATVDAHRWGCFGDIGPIRVGVKTCADSVFIRSDWGEMPAASRPELLRPLTTHHIARRYKPLAPECPRAILYPHVVEHGRRRAVDLARYPRSRAYLESHRERLEGRRYVIEAGREWHEIWVPHDPTAWAGPKLVFRDIAVEGTFWIDLEGTVVNGDCYWLACNGTADIDWLWLAAAVGNSTFIERFYDHRFPNKLYAGRRRFITQYVEQFPLPDPGGRLGKALIAMAKRIYDCVGFAETGALEEELNGLVWEAFGFDCCGASAER